MLTKSGTKRQAAGHWCRGIAFLMVIYPTPTSLPGLRAPNNDRYLRKLDKGITGG